MEGLDGDGLRWSKGKYEGYQRVGLASGVAAVSVPCDDLA